MYINFSGSGSYSEILSHCFYYREVKKIRGSELSFSLILFGSKKPICKMIRYKYIKKLNSSLIIITELINC